MSNVYDALNFFKVKVYIKPGCTLVGICGINNSLCGLGRLELLSRKYLPQKLENRSSDPIPHRGRARWRASAYPPTGGRVGRILRFAGETSSKATCSDPVMSRVPAGATTKETRLLQPLLMKT